ncbi:disease resistance protein [Perilla frutescens var. hirtella]|uniref:Disease resistance protein n=1 Tax=Perilla frutescens var. hirtella TaxID=608512 RepID=A0AAD4PAE9_PERFH|nr:disease resistance protein [Perilla frutescens var. hirtella]KAH6831895.1 disease resistance protein [Perilla frutescens var. hirtella]
MIHLCSLPNLEVLKIRDCVFEDRDLRNGIGCSALVEIPCGIGEIPMLQTIKLDECSPSLVASAQLIIEEKCELGNYDLQLRTTFCKVGLLVSN